MYTGVFGGLAWGSLYLSDPVKRDSLWQRAQGKVHSVGRLLVVSEVKDWAVSAKDATVDTLNEIYNRILEVSKNLR